MKWKILVLLLFSLSYSLQSQEADHPEIMTDTVLLAKLIQSERVPGNYQDMLAIGTVVMNRINRSDYPSEIPLVIFQRNKFHGVDTYLFNKVPDKDALYAAREVLKGFRSFGPDVIYYTNMITATDSAQINYLKSLDKVVTYGSGRYQHSYFIKP